MTKSSFDLLIILRPITNRESGSTIKAVQRKSDVNALQKFINGTGIVWFLIRPSVIVVGKQTLCKVNIVRNDEFMFAEDGTIQRKKQR